MARGCVQAGCALLGGETAEHPGTSARTTSTWPGRPPAWSRRTPCSARTGCGPATRCSPWPRPGCTPTATRWSGEILDAQAGLDLGQDLPELSRSLGEELLEPSRIYALDCLALAAACDVHAYAHVTGGGLAANLARVLPGDVDAVLDRGTWTPAGDLRPCWPRHGRVARDEMERVFNMGVGMTAVVAAGCRPVPPWTCWPQRGVPAWVLGEVIPGSGEARLDGKH